MSRHRLIGEPQPSMLVAEQGINHGFCETVKLFETGELFRAGQATLTDSKDVLLPFLACDRGRT